MTNTSVCDAIDRPFAHVEAGARLIATAIFLLEHTGRRNALCTMSFDDEDITLMIERI
ncbi:hypothetical protein GCM10027093_11170 [Paraburkholderia jirisanensis]